MLFILTTCLFVLLVVWKVWTSSPINIGKLGETRVAIKLDRLPKGYITINDVLLPTQRGTTQIDHLVISQYGIFVIETKNYKGWILGHENSEYWTQSLIGRGWINHKHNFRNPIKQNDSHVKALKRLLKDIGDFKIIPIIVFSDNATLKTTTPYNTVINWSQLRSTILAHHTKCISITDLPKIIKQIDLANVTNQVSRNNHAIYVQSIQHKKEIALDNFNCPKCGHPLTERYGINGQFIGCTNYPKCKFTTQKLSHINNS